MKKSLPLALCLLFLIVYGPLNASAQQFKVLLFTKTAGWHHESIQEGVEAIRKMGERNAFQVVWEENADRVFTEQFLSSFQGVIFLNTTGDVLNDVQQKVFENFIRSGKGYVGIHSAADTEYDWQWYTQLVGHMFVIHPAVQTAKLVMVDTNFPGMDKFDNNQLWTDEWYQYSPATVKDLHYLIAVDEKSYSPKADWGPKKGEGMGDFHPISWYHDFDGGRAFYTGLGHIPLTFSDPDFLTHLYGGIYWAATGKR